MARHDQVPRYLPTPEEIEAETAKIKAAWTPEEERRRQMRQPRREAVLDRKTATIHCDVAYVPSGMLPPANDWCATF